MKSVKVIAICECSGTIRDAFIERGFDAWSCDTQASDGKYPEKHFKGDVIKLIENGIIDIASYDVAYCFPPCTALASSGAWTWPAKRADGTQQKAEAFFMYMVNLPVKHILIENPVGRMSTIYRKPDQIIQPWQFGDDASKKTCLWLKNLPNLEPTDIIIKERYANQTPSGQNKLGPSANRSKLRAKTYQGIANAIADQHGDFLKK